MRKADTFYARVDEFWRKEEKFCYLEAVQYVENINWQLIQPNKKFTWLTEGLNDEFETFTPIGNKETKESFLDDSTVFINYSRGAETTRDTWVYNYDQVTLVNNVKLFISTYNEQVYKWHTQRKPSDTLDSFVLYDDRKIKWSSRLKECLATNTLATFYQESIRNSLYRPFTFQYLYFDSILTHRRGQFPLIFPTPATEEENRVICVSGVGSNKPFHSLVVAAIPCLDMLEKTQCFPFYTYNEDGSNRRENITDWALEQFCTHYQDNTITKWDIFYYTYAVLHHPLYQERYAANLKRELPRIPYASDFHAFARGGQRLAEIHVKYEQQPEYPLRRIENNDLPLDWQVEKMKLTQDKTAIIYNDFLTLSGIPPETFNYRLGNRSALEWVIDQYRVSADKRSEIVNNPNRQDDPEYIVRLIGKVITVSLETVQIVNALPSLGLLEPNNNEVLSSTGLEI